MRHVVRVLLLAAVLAYLLYAAGRFAIVMVLFECCGVTVW
jgi:hypothetical protein